MSHFTVLVIGDNPEDQLEPYNENTEVADYVKDVVTREEKQYFMNYYIEKDNSLRGLSFESLYGLNGKSWNNNEWVKDDDGNWYSHSTYNPDSKWDWYQLGGRWRGFLKLKNNADGVVGNSGVFDNDAQEGWVDQTLKGNVDFEFMRSQKAKEAAETYDKFHAIVGDRPIPSWNEIRARYPANIELARKEYNENPVVIDVKESPDFREYFWFSDMSDFIESRADYIESARNSALSTFAFVKDGKWYEKGEMGWWAIVINEKDQDEWNKEFNIMLDNLPDDTLLSVYDCHI